MAAGSALREAMSLGPGHSRSAGVERRGGTKMWERKGSVLDQRDLMWRIEQRREEVIVWKGYFL